MKKVILLDEKCLEGQDGLKRVLDRNYSLYYFTGSDGVLEEIDRTMPDIVILACERPGCGAVEVCSDIKGDPLTNDTPVLVLSKMGGLMQIENALRAGVDSYVVMPAPEAMILDRIAAVLEKYSGRKVPEPISL